MSQSHCIPSPAQEPLPVLLKLILDQGFGQCVRWQVVCVDFKKFKWVILSCSKLHKVKHLAIKMLGSGTHLGELGDGSSSTVVFKELAVHNGSIR